MQNSELVSQCLELISGQSHEIRENESNITIHINLAGYQGANRNIVVEPKRNLITIYSNSRHVRAITDEHKKSCLAFISKANELISFGNIEMNYDNGEFRYKTSQAFPGVRDPKPIISFMLELHNNIFGKLCDVLPKVLSNHDPADCASLLLRI